MEWTPITPDMPSHDVLLWVEGRCVIGFRLAGVTRGKSWSVFMDSRTDALLPEPSHWMALPGPPHSGPDDG